MRYREGGVPSPPSAYGVIQLCTCSTKGLLPRDPSTRPFVEVPPPKLVGHREPKGGELGTLVRSTKYLPRGQLISLPRFPPKAATGHLPYD